MTEPVGPVLSAVYRVFAPSRAQGGRLWLRWRETLLKLRPLGAISAGNRITVYANGDDSFEAQWLALASAREQVVMNMYIMADDRVGRRMRDELVAAAERGAQVHLQLDAFASQLDDHFLAPFERAGIQVAHFNPMFRWSSRLSRLVRNHRKILVIDGQTAFAGGMNVSEDYAGERHGNGTFRDTHLKIEGPAAFDLGVIAASVFEEEQRPTIIRAPVSASVEDPSDTLVQVLESNVRRERRAIQKALLLTLENATETCWLTSPYFVPPRSLLRALKQAARRDIDVRVLTAGLSDVPMVRRASQHLYGSLLRAGVRVFELQTSTLHAKTVVVDGVWGSIGSFNLDRWSYRRNLEVTVALLDSRHALDLEDAFRLDLEGAHEVQLGPWKDRPWWLRLGHWCAFQLMRI